jgi:hypothetical protein
MKKKNESKNIMSPNGIAINIEHQQKSLTYYNKFLNNDKQPNVSPFIDKLKTNDSLVEIYREYDEEFNELEEIENYMKWFKKNFCTEDRNFLSENEDGLCNSSDDKTFVETRIKRFRQICENGQTKLS